MEIKCVFWFSLQRFMQHFSFKEQLCKKLLQMYGGLNVKYSYYCQLWMKSDIYRLIKKKTRIPNLMKIISVGAELFRAGGRTDGHNTANSRFSKYANKPNNTVTS
jgi:16S rRNA G1207 methylase RsmC